MVIQVTGSRGMLGSAVCRAVEAAGHTLITNSEVDIESDREVVAPVLINCVGIVKQLIQVPAYEFARVNAYAPHWLAHQCEQVGTRLIHISTDCVFTLPGPHSESDMPSPVDLYARSKLAGEVMRSPHLTVRTSFVGHGPRGLLHNLETDKEMRISRSAWWTGHTVDTVARVLVLLAEQENVSGLLHIPAQMTKRIDLAQMLIDAFHFNCKIVEVDEHWEDRRLISERWWKLGFMDLPPLAEQIAEMTR